VVDQTTTEVEKFREKLIKPVSDELIQLASRLRSLSAIASRDDSHAPIAISTLRGQFADNREWSADPSRPAVICGTVDMMGSRLLFSGYGIGFKAKPLHAGFLGQDALLVHDEAHLEPAFQKLIERIEQVQDQERKHSCQVPWSPLRVMALTATSRGSGMALTLDDRDLVHPVVRQRINATKTIHLHEVDDEKSLPDRIADLALTFKDSDRAVLIFVRRIEDIDKIMKKLSKSNAELLTGTLRGLERDELVKRPIFQRFLPEANRDEHITPEPGTVYLICTSAGEVGVNMSGDDLVGDVATLESMAQRLGRLNRFGIRDDSLAHIVHPAEFSDKDPLASQRKAALKMLQRLDGDGSPHAISELIASLSNDERKATFAPEPETLFASDALFDAWALTSIRKKLPGRPRVEPFLHGIAEWQPPQTFVAWREEVDMIVGDLLDRYPPEELLEDFPLKPRELLRDRSDRVFEVLQLLAASNPLAPVWVLDEHNNVLRNGQFDRPWLLGELADPSATQAAVKKPLLSRIEGATVLLPPSVGGLGSRGMLDADSPNADDVSHIDFPETERRTRIWSDNPQPLNTSGMRLIRGIIAIKGDENGESRTWNWYKQKPVEDTRTARKPVLWNVHVGDVTRHTDRILAALSLPPELAAAVRVAADLHDHGKQRRQFQNALGNRDFPAIVFAKSGEVAAKLPEIYRHEFGSLADAQSDAGFKVLSPDMQDIVLHLIAAHHGRGRPHFSADELLDWKYPESLWDELANDVPRRFARLQRGYGRWGLAYLESLLRAADWAASAEPSEYLTFD
jgi:CRISPR-associated endonuclease/helicase Cas3